MSISTGFLPGAIRCPHCAMVIQAPSLKASADYIRAKQLILAVSGKYQPDLVRGGKKRWKGVKSKDRWEFMLRARAKMTGKKGETGRRKLAEWEAKQAKRLEPSDHSPPGPGGVEGAAGSESPSGAAATRTG